MFNEVVAAIDGSPASFRAAEIGAQIAAASKGSIALLAVAPRPSEIKSRLGIGAGTEEAKQAQHVAFVQSAEAALGRIAPKLSTELLVGEPVDEILSRCEACEEELPERLICMGSGRHGMRLGSVSSAVVRNASCPVLVVREGTSRSPRLQRILLAYDGSPGAQSAVEGTGVLSARTGAAVQLVWVLIPSFPLPPSGLPLGNDEVKAMAGEPERQELERAARRIVELGGMVTGTLFEMGKPADRVLAQADAMDVDLIVVGARGRHQTLRRVLGGVSDQITARSSRPVLVMKG